VRQLLILQLAAWLGGCAAASAASDGHEALLLARLVWEERAGPIYGFDGGPKRLFFRVQKVLLGTFRQKKLVFVETLAADPAPNIQYFIAVDKTSQGPKILWFDFNDYGLCMDENDMKTVSLDSKTLSPIERKYPCTYPGMGHN
jgi:hypothetical protein